MNLEEIRLQKLNNWKNFQNNIYPDKFNKTHNNKEIKLIKDETKNINTAGRIINIREIGQLSFITLKDFSDNIQLVLKKDILKENYKFFLNNLDIGDHIGVTGETFTTKSGEKSLLIENLTLLSKSLLPLPDKWHGIIDTELKLRKRYLDLIMNEEVKERFIKRNIIINSIKKTLNNNNFIEVETPILQNIASGAMANPFKTHHKALNLPLFLRIAPETYLKRLITGGFERIYEIGKNFRNEGVDTSHLQEFTMLEYYAAYWNFEDSINFIKTIFNNIFKDLNLENEITYENKKININTNSWETITYENLIYKFTKLNLTQLLKNEELLKSEVSKFIDISKCKSNATIIDTLYKKYCRPNLINPTIITNQPAILGPLARKNDDNLLYSDRFQIVIDGLEVVNSYSELIDPVLQKSILIEQQNHKNNGEEEFMEMEDDFIEAMEYGMPPISGLGLGIDRIVAILTNCSTLKDVVFFPNLK